MKNKFSDIILSERPTLVDFYAEWCGPCKMQVPVLEELSRKTGNKLKILKIDIDKNPEVSSRFGIRSIPTLLLFQRGEIIWRHIGIAPLDELQQVMHYHCK